MGRGSSSSLSPLDCAGVEHGRPRSSVVLVVIYWCVQCPLWLCAVWRSLLAAAPKLPAVIIIVLFFFSR